MPQNQARSTTSKANPPNQRIHFVSGKGGVGKSLVAAAIARREKLAGRRVLLVEIGDKSYYKDFFGVPEIGHEPRRLPSQGFDVAMWSGETCLREYVLYYLKLETLYHLFFENKVMRSLINVAPGLNEVAILGKITSGIRKVGPPLNYDVIVVDSYATGHAMALLQAPKGMMEAIKFGPMGVHSREMEAVVQNPEISKYTLVTLAEELPVVETVEFNERLKKELGVEADVVCNKMLPIPASEEELNKLIADGSEGLKEFSRYLESHLKRQKEFTEVLRLEFKERRKVPLLFFEDPNELVNATEEAMRTVEAT